MPEPEILPDEDKPGLEINSADLPASVYALRDLLAQSGTLFDRGRVLVRLVTDADGVMYTLEMKPSDVVIAAHQVCQPFKVKMEGGNRVQVPITLPMNAALMYLNMGEWNLQPLAGISTAPLLRADGSLISTRGYDRASQIYCNCQIAVDVPERPSKKRAKAALKVLRDAFKTFPFVDSPMLKEGDDKIAVVDIENDPGLNESTALAALLTAVCRASLWTAPGVLIGAPHLSGSGAGKGLLLRGVSMIAFGIAPPAFPTGPDAAELDKRIGAALLTGAPVLLLDNVNGRTLRSETLASALTERPSQVRVLGRSTMLPLNCAAFIALTGNALRVAEDLVRRLLRIDIDPEMDDPESRKFDPGFVGNIRGARVQLLAAALIILRWGRQQAGTLKRGIPMGSFEQWAEWVRDPLIELGCQDPVIAIKKAKESDPARQEISELFTLWNRHHGEEAVAVKNVHEDILAILNPHKQKTQFVTRALQKMNGTRHAGFVFREARRGGVHSRARFILQQTLVLETPHETLETPFAPLETKTVSGGAKPSKTAAGRPLPLETLETDSIHGARDLTENREDAREKMVLGAASAAGRFDSRVSGVSGAARKKGGEWWRHAVLHVSRRDNKKRVDERRDQIANGYDDDA